MNEESKLSLVIKDSGLEQTERDTLLGKFSMYESVAEDWAQKAKAIVVTSAEQTAEMKMAREGRLFLAQKRIDVEKVRKALKEQSLRKGQAIDAVAKFLTSLIEPTERYLKEQEDFVEIQNKKKAEELRLIEEARLETERLAKEEAERKEQERIKLENEKLKLELEKKQKAMEAERKAQEEKANKMLAEARAKQEVELQKERKAHELARKQLEVEAKKAEDKLKRLIKCPYCYKEFSLEEVKK